MDTVRRLMLSATFRLAGSLVIGAGAGLATATVLRPVHGVLIGIAATATVFVIAAAAVLWPMSADATRDEAQRENLGPMLDEVIIAVAGACGVGVTVALLILGGSDAGYLPALIGLLSVFMVWAGLHLMYATRYAYLFYDEGQSGGIAFGIGTDPTYREFLYFSYSVGISSGIPGGVGVSDARILTVVLRHGLLSYVFRTVVMAAAINVVVGVFTGQLRHAHATGAETATAAPARSRPAPGGADHGRARHRPRSVVTDSGIA